MADSQSGEVGEGSEKPSENTNTATNSDETDIKTPQIPVGPPHSSSRFEVAAVNEDKDEKSDTAGGNGNVAPGSAPPADATVKPSPSYSATGASQAESNLGSELSSEDAKPNRFSVRFADGRDDEAADNLEMSSLGRGAESPPASPQDTQGDTHHRTFGHNTIDAIPLMDYYRNSSQFLEGEDVKRRPTLVELHEGKTETKSHKRGDSVLLDIHSPSSVEEETGAQKPAGPAAIKFGWIKGVLVRCLLNIWGVMLFIRLSWVVGQAGIGFSSIIILLSAVVTTVTTLSMSAICTNGEVKGGGAYYLISRSLGPEFGGAIGLIFSLANAVAVAMYVVGFAETVRDLLKDNNALMTDETNDIRIVGCITIVLLLGITMLGMEWEAKAQLGLLVILVIAILNYFIGAFIPATRVKMSKGFLNYQGQIFTDNWVPDFREGESFFSVFSVFFPAATGILAGANISGDLTDPSTAIPKGTLLAILISTLVYLGAAWSVGACVIRDAGGNSTVLSLLYGDVMGNTTLPTNFTGPPSIRELIDGISVCPEGECYYGLINNKQVMEMVSGFGPIVTAGIFAATLSSALASLVSAPKVFQAVCKDKLFPGIHIFAKGVGQSDEPRRGYLLAFVIAVGFILIAELNAIAPLISNFFLMAYALINYACFASSLARSPGWRPSFKYYNMWVALVGSLVCLAIMFVINWYMALITLGVICAIYVYLNYQKPDVNWGSSAQAQMYTDALKATLKLGSVGDHIKTYRPQLLVLTGAPHHRPPLVDLGSHITKDVGLMICGQVIQGELTQANIRKCTSQKENKWMQKRKVKGFTSVVCSPNLRTGVQSMLQLTGMGKMRPNSILMGYKHNWRSCTYEEIDDYVGVIHDAFDMNYGVCVLRMKGGLDISTIETKKDRMTVTPDSGLGRTYVYSVNTEKKPTTLELPNTNGPTEGNTVSSTPDSVQLTIASATSRTSFWSSGAAAFVGSSPMFLPQDFYKASPMSVGSAAFSCSPSPSILLTEPPLPFPVCNGSAVVIIDTSSSPDNSAQDMPREDSKAGSAESSPNYSPQDSPTLPHRTPAEIPENEIETTPLAASSENIAQDSGDEGGEEDNHHRCIHKGDEGNILKDVDMSKFKTANTFQNKQKKGTIDVWWLFDDGGLTLLVPHLLSLKSQWKHCKLRVFTGGKKSRIDHDRRMMAALLSKFRIDVHDVYVLGDMNHKPRETSKTEFDNLIDPWRLKEHQFESDEGRRLREQYPEKISDDEYETVRDRVNRHLRLRELLQEHSKDASLIVITLPMPRRGVVSTVMYMAWLEILSKDLPPVLMMRGNQQSVLTFYS
ncbi:solute carrier family 12 member 1-like isoform X1 [Branchiostoma floridae]|uniref:Solute carrier family 12 member 1-like isoform X1 n=1 Tax=Branchiostoma floridae TaxID=7739 RepID=A0A9J7KLJ6_BRAFL|nr:solute carrier family 12 member 1-like isoform X1 [Branchiostoma floridae]